MTSPERVIMFTVIILNCFCHGQTQAQDPSQHIQGALFQKHFHPFY